MYSSTALPRILQVTIALIVCGSLFAFSNVSLLVSDAAQNPGQNRPGRPKPGKPEGSLPDLEDVQNESRSERQPAPPIPSTIRSPKVPLEPWNGRRVGDPGTRGELGQAINRTRRAHASRRENVRRAFEECSEFAGILASIVPNGSPTTNAASLISARVNPKNQPGNGMSTRDGTWSVPLLSLPGRAGLDLGLGLSYSSMVWTRSGPYIHFDEGNGFPSPGFRLGFPVVQRRVFDAQTAKNSFLFITAAGRRVELRQVGTSNIYEAGDSSYLQLIDNSPTLVVRSTDGTQRNFVEINNEYGCTQIKDRNGNYLTIKSK